MVLWPLILGGGKKMLTNTEKENLRLFVLKELPNDGDKIDISSKIDSSLSYEENKNILWDEIEIFKKNEVTKKDVINMEYKADMQKATGENIGLPEIFQDCHVVGLAGERNTGKTNNLIYLLLKFREKNKTTPVFCYGFPINFYHPFQRLDIKSIDSMGQLVNKQNAILIIEEFQRLKLNDRRYKEVKDMFMDFIYHSNIFCILSSPNIREFNSVIGASIEKWLCKSVNIDSCVNGSQLKDAIGQYNSVTYKKIGSLLVPKNQIIDINPNNQKVINCQYVEWADTKKTLPKLF